MRKLFNSEEIWLKKQLKEGKRKSKTVERSQWQYQTSDRQSKYQAIISDEKHHHRTSERIEMIFQTLCLLSDASIGSIGCPILLTASWLFSYLLSVGRFNEALSWFPINSAWSETSKYFSLHTENTKDEE